MQGYTDTILKYAADQTYIGRLENPDGTGEVGLSGQSIGKRLAVRFTLNINRNQIKEIRFQVFGCGFTIAACAAAAELSEGRRLDEVQRYSSKLIADRLGGLPEERDYCAELANQALQAAIVSAQKETIPVQTDLLARHDQQQGPALGRNNPTYRALLKAPTPLGVDDDDRQLFAGLLTVVIQEQRPLATTLGLTEEELNALRTLFFPGCDSALFRPAESATTAAPASPLEIQKIMLAHVPGDTTAGRTQTAEWLAKAIAARSTRPGHLWVAMGFFERPQLTAAIRRHLPTLAAANHKGMRWKRYLFKQVCEINGGQLCKSPDCGDCSDYAFCFAPEDE